MAITNWTELGLILITTGDGSPSLRLSKSVRLDFEDGESMHHSGGALTETIYIYAPVFDGIINSPKKIKTHLVVGLGLGYIEMLIAIKSLQAKISPENTRLLTFEIVDELRSTFLDFIYSRPLNENIFSTYETVLSQMLVALRAEDVSPEQVRLFLQQTLTVKAELNDQALDEHFLGATSEPSSFQAIYFDTYSKKTSPELWSEEFLFDFLKKFADSEFCFLGTYACNGNLKRSLRKSEFQMAEKLGFMAKRDATLAWRIRLSE